MQNKQKSSFQGKESFSRMNFLFQASKLMAEHNPVLSAYYGNLCKSIGKKSVLRMHPNVKRSLCKKCSLAQEPGITSEIFATATQSRSLSRSNIDQNTDIHLKCRQCGHNRRFRIDLNHKFWLENPESVVDVVNLNQKIKESITEIGIDNNETEKRNSEQLKGKHKQP